MASEVPPSIAAPDLEALIAHAAGDIDFAIDVTEPLPTRLGRFSDVLRAFAEQVRVPLEADLAAARRGFVHVSLLEQAEEQRDAANQTASRLFNERDDVEKRAEQAEAALEAERQAHVETQAKVRRAEAHVLVDRDGQTLTQGALDHLLCDLDDKVKDLETRLADAQQWIDSEPDWKATFLETYEEIRHQRDEAEAALRIKREQCQQTEAQLAALRESARMWSDPTPELEALRTCEVEKIALQASLREKLEATWNDCWRWVKDAGDKNDLITARAACIDRLLAAPEPS